MGRQISRKRPDSPPPSTVFWPESCCTAPHCPQFFLLAPMYCYKFTFISVREEGHDMKRCQSLPPRRQEHHEEDYVAELEKRASSRSFLTEVQAPSVGSLGHPELCRKPCILLAHGKCTEGSKCKFCHHAHRTGVKFNKAQREILRSLGEAEALKLLLPYLRVRAKKLPEAQAEPVIQALEQRLQELPEGTPVPANRAAQLSKTLTQMSFRRLILLCRSQEISRAFAELLQIYDADF
ncbi:unnamed protein product [Effrenium voratum]|nr:unnamed protein product [Effrenium voratum]